MRIMLPIKYRGEYQPTEQTLRNAIPGCDQALSQHTLRERGIVIQGSGTIRLVTHLDIGESDIERVVAAFKAYLTR